MKTKVLFFASLMALSLCTSQVQAVHVNPVVAPIIKMCYCLDSYLGLGYDYIEDYYYVDDELPMNWIVRDTIAPPVNKWWSYSHKLIVEYGRRWGVKPPLPDPD
jgi:hypothetical protein